MPIVKNPKLFGKAKLKCIRCIFAIQNVWENGQVKTEWVRQIAIGAEERKEDHHIHSDGEEFCERKSEIEIKGFAKFVAKQNKKMGKNWMFIILIGIRII